MLNCMRVPMLLLAACAVTLPSIPARAQDSARASIMQAYELWRGGQPKAAIAILEPELRQDTLGFTEEERGAAWDILGSSYQDLETFDRARQAYGKAVQTLRSVPSAQAQYAAALNNLPPWNRRWGRRTQRRRSVRRRSVLTSNSEILLGLPLRPPILLGLRAPRRISRRRDARSQRPSRKRRPPPN